MGSTLAISRSMVEKQAEYVIGRFTSRALSRLVGALAWK